MREKYTTSHHTHPLQCEEYSKTCFPLKNCSQSAENNGSWIPISKTRIARFNYQPLFNQTWRRCPINVEPIDRAKKKLTAMRWRQILNRSSIEITWNSLHKMEMNFLNDVPKLQFFFDDGEWCVYDRGKCVELVFTSAHDVLRAVHTIFFSFGNFVRSFIRFLDFCMQSVIDQWQ